MYLLGYDIGSSSVKACLVKPAERLRHRIIRPRRRCRFMLNVRGGQSRIGDVVGAPKTSPSCGDEEIGVRGEEIKAIGISWQMHGLVLVDKNRRVLRPSIIWCDSRAVPYGEKAFEAIGRERALSHLLNSPGNFTASKLAWVKENEPEIYRQIHKIMLPGDYIAMKLTGSIGMTIEGLSEGIFWDFKENRISEDVMNYFGFDHALLPDIVPIFGTQGTVSAEAAAELGLKEGTPVGYRAGDQPNNAVSLNVFNPGEIASTAGTSGVIYGILGEIIRSAFPDKHFCSCESYP